MRPEIIPSSPELRVVHIGAGRYSASDRTHSTFSIWRELARGAGDYVVIGRSTDRSAGRIIEDNLRVELIGSALQSESEFLLTQLRAWKIGRQADPDVVVCQCPVLGGLAGTLIRKQTGARLLMEFHGFHYFADNPLFSRAGVLERLTTLNLRNASRIRVLSNGMKERVLRRYGDQFESRIVVLPPRVDLKLFSRPRSTHKPFPVAAMVGSVNENKGQLRFLRAFLAARLSGYVWIIGDGPDLETCKKLVSDHGAGGRVQFFGRVNHQRLSELLADADVLVQFSRWEATPRAIMEGMAAGLPVISTDAGFCRDVFRHGIDGYLLGSNPVAEVAQYLSTLFDDDGLRQRMGASARAHATSEYDAGRLYDRYRQLIRETAAA